MKKDILRIRELLLRTEFTKYRDFTCGINLRKYNLNTNVASIISIDSFDKTIIYPSIAYKGKMVFTLLCYSYKIYPDGVLLNCISADDKSKRVKLKGASIKMFTELITSIDIPEKHLPIFRFECNITISDGYPDVEIGKLKLIYYIDLFLLFDSVKKLF